MAELSIGTGRSMCSGCGLYFTSVNAFDQHRVGKYPNRRCLTEEELTAKGWEPNEEGFWRKPFNITEVGV